MKVPTLLVAVAAAALAAAAQADVGPPAPKPTTAFHAGDYASPRFHVTSADYQANGLDVRMIQVQDREPLGFRCRGWLQIRPAGGAPRWIYRGDIEAVGSSYGLFVPPTQPMPRFFLVVELNGYDGKLILVDGKGKVREVPGGAYLVDFQRRLLLSRSFADLPPSLAVLDLDDGKTVFQGVQKEIYNWYRLDSDLFFTATRAAGS